MIQTTTFPARSQSVISSAAVNRSAPLEIDAAALVPQAENAISNMEEWIAAHGSTSFSGPPSDAPSQLHREISARFGFTGAEDSPQPSESMKEKMHGRAVELQKIGVTPLMLDKLESTMLYRDKWTAAAKGAIGTVPLAASVFASNYYGGALKQKYGDWAGPSLAGAAVGAGLVALAPIFNTDAADVQYGGVPDLAMLDPVMAAQGLGQREAVLKTLLKAAGGITAGQSLKNLLQGALMTTLVGLNIDKGQMEVARKAVDAILLVVVGGAASGAIIKNLDGRKPMAMVLARNDYLEVIQELMCEKSAGTLAGAGQRAYKVARVAKRMAESLQVEPSNIVKNVFKANTIATMLVVAGFVATASNLPQMAVRHLKNEKPAVQKLVAEMVNLLVNAPFFAAIPFAGAVPGMAVDALARKVKAASVPADIQPGNPGGAIAASSHAAAQDAAVGPRR